MVNQVPDESKEISALFSRPFIGACGLILVLCGVVVGVWSSTMEKDISDIRRILDERATLPPRTAELERRTEDQEQRLRTLERQTYRNGWK